ncbi:hypothetical protein L209DRAFT_315539 [Thermothelomyces heterothallicus CBS 203.75]
MSVQGWPVPSRLAAASSIHSPPRAVKDRGKTCKGSRTPATVHAPHRPSPTSWCGLTPVILSHARPNPAGCLVARQEGRGLPSGIGHPDDHDRGSSPEDIDALRIALHQSCDSPNPAGECLLRVSEENVSRTALRAPAPSFQTLLCRRDGHVVYGIHSNTAVGESPMNLVCMAHTSTLCRFHPVASVFPSFPFP